MSNPDWPLPEFCVVTMLRRPNRSPECCIWMPMSWKDLFSRDVLWLVKVSDLTFSNLTNLQYINDLPLAKLKVSDNNLTGLLSCRNYHVDAMLMLPWFCHVDVIVFAVIGLISLCYCHLDVTVYFVVVLILLCCCYWVDIKLILLCWCYCVGVRFMVSCWSWRVGPRRWAGKIVLEVARK